ncbi:hypothetical protein COLO4_03150, partial [Corchorus olitorius]
MVQKERYENRQTNSKANRKNVQGVSAIQRTAEAGKSLNYDPKARSSTPLARMATERVEVLQVRLYCGDDTME